MATGGERLSPPLFGLLLAVLLQTVLGVLLLPSAAGTRVACPELGSILDCGKKKLSDVPRSLPPWVQTLRLDSNLISHVPGDAFDGLAELEELVLSNNRLTHFNASSICRLPRLRVLKLSRNYLTEIPDLKGCANLKELYLNGNNISSFNAVSALSGLSSLIMLDLSRNPLENLGANVFPTDSAVKHLNLADCGIESIDPAAFSPLGESLERLKLGRNKLAALPRGLFAGNKRIVELDLSRNRFRHIEHTTFEDLDSVRNLTLRRNEIEALRDGSFFECKQLEMLNLEDNRLASLRVGSFFGLHSLKELYLAGNNISSIDVQVWEQAKAVTILDLSRNSLQRLGSGTLAGLRALRWLSLSGNGLQTIDDRALESLDRLETLDLSGNRLSDMLQRPPQSVFSRLALLTALDLHSNAINSVSRKLFQGLGQLRQLALRNNPITTIEQGAFDDLRQLIAFEMNSAKLVCDCKLGWLPEWLNAASFVSSVSGTCFEPSSLRGRRIYDLDRNDFACDAANEQSLRPVIGRWPAASVSALRHASKTLSCEATVRSPKGPSAAEAPGVESSQPVNCQWIKDGQIVQDRAEEVQLRTEVQRSSADGPTRYVSVLVLTNVTDEDEGYYQCSFANEFGHTFSPKVELRVLVYPQFTIVPSSIVAKAEQDVSLKCSATGQPPPEISIQKDGGVNFPSARDRRFSFNQETNEFIIRKTRAEDAGVYYCVARNDAGTNVANATVSIIEPPRFVGSSTAGPECPRSSQLGQSVVLTCPVEGSPAPDIVWLHNGAAVESSGSPRRLTLSSRSTKLIIEIAQPSDAGVYTCVASNLLGKAEGSCRLRLHGGPTLPDGVASSDTVDDYDGQSSSSLDVDGPMPVETGIGHRLDSTTITGIIVIAAVCGVVGTSLVWVAIIYYMRHRRLHRQRAAASCTPGCRSGSSRSSSSCGGSNGGLGTGGGSSSSSSGAAGTDETLLAAPEIKRNFAAEAHRWYGRGVLLSVGHASADGSQWPPRSAADSVGGEMQTLLSTEPSRQCERQVLLHHSPYARLPAASAPNLWEASVAEPAPSTTTASRGRSAACGVPCEQAQQLRQHEEAPPQSGSLVFGGLVTFSPRAVQSPAIVTRRLGSPEASRSSDHGSQHEWPRPANATCAAATASSQCERSPDAGCGVSDGCGTCDQSHERELDVSAAIRLGLPSDADCCLQQALAQLQDVSCQQLPGALA